MLVYLFFVFSCGWCVCWLIFLNYQQHARDYQQEAHQQGEQHERLLFDLQDTSPGLPLSALGGARSRRRPVRRHPARRLGDLVGLSWLTGLSSEANHHQVDEWPEMRLVVDDEARHSLLGPGSPAPELNGLLQVDTCPDEGTWPAGEVHLEAPEIGNSTGEAYASHQEAAAVLCARCRAPQQVWAGRVVEEEEEEEWRGWPTEAFAGPDELAPAGGPREEDEDGGLLWPIVQLHENPLNWVPAEQVKEAREYWEPWSALERSLQLSLASGQEENRAAIRMISSDSVQLLVTEAISKQKQERPGEGVEEVERQDAGEQQRSLSNIGRQQQQQVEDTPNREPQKSSLGLLMMQERAAGKQTRPTTRRQAAQSNREESGITGKAPGSNKGEEGGGEEAFSGGCISGASKALAGATKSQDEVVAEGGNNDTGSTAQPLNNSLPRAGSGGGSDLIGSTCARPLSSAREFLEQPSLSSAPGSPGRRTALLLSPGEQAKGKLDGGDSMAEAGKGLVSSEDHFECGSGGECANSERGLANEQQAAVQSSPPSSGGLSECRWPQHEQEQAQVRQEREREEKEQQREQRQAELLQLMRSRLQQQQQVASAAAAINSQELPTLQQLQLKLQQQRTTRPQQQQQQQQQRTQQWTAAAAAMVQQQLKQQRQFELQQQRRTGENRAQQQQRSNATDGQQPETGACCAAARAMASSSIRLEMEMEQRARPAKAAERDKSEEVSERAILVNNKNSAGENIQNCQILLGKQVAEFSGPNKRDKEAQGKSEQYNHLVKGQNKSSSGIISDFEEQKDVCERAGESRRPMQLTLDVKQRQEQEEQHCHLPPQKHEHTLLTTAHFGTSHQMPMEAARGLVALHSSSREEPPEPSASGKPVPTPRANQVQSQSGNETMASYNNTATGPRQAKSNVQEELSIVTSPSCLMPAASAPNPRLRDLASAAGSNGASSLISSSAQSTPPHSILSDSTTLITEAAMNSSELIPKLIERLDRKLIVMKEEQLTLMREIELNESTGQRLFQSMKQRLTVNEYEKISLHANEIEKVTKLILSLKLRLKRVESELKERSQKELATRKSALLCADNQSANNLSSAEENLTSQRLEQERAQEEMDEMDDEMNRPGLAHQANDGGERIMSNKSSSNSLRLINGTTAMPATTVIRGLSDPTSTIGLPKRNHQHHASLQCNIPDQLDCSSSNEHLGGSNPLTRLYGMGAAMAADSGLPLGSVSTSIGSSASTNETNLIMARHHHHHQLSLTNSSSYSSSSRVCSPREHEPTSNSSTAAAANGNGNSKAAMLDHSNGPKKKNEMTSSEASSNDAAGGPKTAASTSSDSIFNCADSAIGSTITGHGGSATNIEQPAISQSSLISSGTASSASSTRSSLASSSGSAHRHRTHHHHSNSPSQSHLSSNMSVSSHGSISSVPNSPQLVSPASTTCLSGSGSGGSNAPTPTGSGSGPASASSQRQEQQQPRQHSKDANVSGPSAALFGAPGGNSASGQQLSVKSDGNNNNTTSAPGFQVDAANDSSMMSTATNSLTDSDILLAKRNKLVSQLEEAHQLEECIVHRNNIIVQRILKKYYDESAGQEGEIAEFKQFTRLKSLLLKDTHDIADRINNAELQLNELKQTSQ